MRSEYRSRDFVPLRGSLNPYLQQMSPLADLDWGEGRPIATGFKDVDTLLGGMNRSDLIVLAGRPRVGKSALALNIARNAAAPASLGSGATVGIFSLETGEEQILLRLLSAEARVDMHNLRMRLLNEQEQSRVIDSIGVLSDLPIFVIADTAVQTVEGMLKSARCLKTQHGLDLLVIDQLELIRGDNLHDVDCEPEVMRHISRSLKAMARELEVPILALSQLGYAVQSRPRLHDLDECLEQDSDVVAFIHRENKFVTEEDWERQNPGQMYPRGLAELIVAKHRHGPTGSLELAVQDHYGRFVSCARPRASGAV